MAYTPVSGVVPQFSTTANELADGYYLKFYVANTPDPLSMATDDTGLTLLSECKLNPDGYPISNPSDNKTVFIPHLPVPYRAVLYINKTDADNDTTANAVWNVPDVNIVGVNAVQSIDSVADLAGFEGSVDGQQVSRASWHPGWSATSSGVPVGAGIEVWHATGDRADHNGGTIKSPTVPWTTTTADYLNGVGETAIATPGTWVLLYESDVNVTWFGATGDFVANDQPSIQAAVNTEANVYFPHPSEAYRLESGIVAPFPGGNQRWYGDHRGGFFDAAGMAVSIIRCVGTNGGDPFIDPPRDVKNLRFEGDAKQGIGITISAFDTFQSNKNWENIIVTGFETGIFGYNWFSMTLKCVACIENTFGIDINPGNGPSDDGYFTATNWENVYIADNDNYGIRANLPLGVRSWDWTNVVVERNGLSSNAQMSMTNVTLDANSCYFEGSPGIDFARLNGCDIHLNNPTMNNVGNWNLTSNNNTLKANGGTLTDITSVSNSTSSVIVLNETYAPTFNPYTLGSNVRYTSRNATTDDGAGSPERLNEVFKNPILGSGITAFKSTTVNVLSNQSVTPVTATINAGASNRIIQNFYVEGLFSGAKGGAYVTQVPDGTTNTGKELIFSVSPNDTGDIRYLDIYAYNPTGSNITLTAREIIITVIK